MSRYTRRTRSLDSDFIHGPIPGASDIDTVSPPEVEMSNDSGSPPNYSMGKDLLWTVGGFAAAEFALAKPGATFSVNTLVMPVIASAIYDSFKGKIGNMQALAGVNMGIQAVAGKSIIEYAIHRMTKVTPPNFVKIAGRQVAGQVASDVIGKQIM